MARKHWYDVQMTTIKFVRIYAEDSQEAQEKAEEKYGAIWIAETASREDGTIE